MNLEHPGLRWLLTGEPRPGQVEALARSYTGRMYRDTRDGPVVPRDLPHVGHVKEGWAHFMQPRVGKTPTWLNEFMMLKSDKGIRKGLMFSPNKFKWTWGKEAQRFGLDVDTYVHDVDTDSLIAALKGNEEGLYVVNYEALVQEKNYKALLEAMEQEQFFLGFDESVKVKNSEATTFKRGLQLARVAPYKRVMSGKPAPQSPMDYFAQLKLLGALHGWNQYQWRAKFCKMGGFKMKKVAGPKNEVQLAEALGRWAFMAERKDWATYYESDYEIVRLNMLPRQQEAYAEMEKDFMMWFEDGTNVAVEMAGHKHMKLQQISSGFIYDETTEPRWIVDFEKTPKFIDLLERIEETVIDKVIVPYVFRPTGEALLKHLAHLKPAFIGGEQAMKQMGVDVESEKHRFNNDPECRVMVCQETAVKYGHTLMGTPENPCLDMIFFENSYSLDDRAQTEERPQGEGQRQAIAIADYASSDVEEKVIRALQQKEQVSQLIWDHYKQLNHSAGSSVSASANP